MREKTDGSFSQLCIEGMETAANKEIKFLPIIYGQTIDEICGEWRFNRDVELQSIIFRLYNNIENHNNILCSISGGYDSDIMLDLIERFGGHGKTTYIFQNTGLEYEATKRHLEFLKERYRVEIEELKPKRAIPTCVREFGVPFWSKYVSQMLQRLQKHNFRWENEPFEELYRRYPRCKSSLRFWCNDFHTDNGRPSKFNIEYVDGLKEFMIANPPQMRISPKCCDYAKKDPAHSYLAAGHFDMNCVGVRKQERGARATSYTSCFDVGWKAGTRGCDQFRPLFYMTDLQKDAYRRQFGIKRSDCYEVWGMKRTGCACCPFGKEFEQELSLAEKYEPKLFTAAQEIFGQSYDYTRRFMEFRKTKKRFFKERRR